MSANSHKRTLRLSVLAPRVFVLAIQFATFRSCVWGAVWIKDHGLSYRFVTDAMKIAVPHRIIPIVFGQSS